MIRFIDLRHHHEDMGERFAFWDTVTNRFIEDDMKCQAWETIGEFAQGYQGDELDRFVGLTPEWAKHAVSEQTQPQHPPECARNRWRKIAAELKDRVVELEKELDRYVT